MQQSEIESKIKQYENYIEEKLKLDLKDIEEALKRKHETYNEWLEVKQVVKYQKRIKELNIDTNIKLNVGCGVYAFGEINEYDKIIVDIGAGCLLEMDYDEADKYANIRINLIKKEISHYRSLAVNVKVHIKYVLLAINELQTTINTKTKKL